MNHSATESSSEQASNFGGEKTRDPNTVIKYLHRASGLEAQAKRSLGLSVDDYLRPDSLIDYLLEKKPTICKNTWRQYKASVLYQLSSSIDPLAIDAVKRLSEIGQSGAMARGTRTSAKKMKTVSVSDLEQIDDYLEDANDNNFTAHRLRVWLHAGLVTGLRPTEWADAKIIDGDSGPILYVKNAKNTNGRSFADVRGLMLRDTDVRVVDLIRAHLDMIEEYVSKGSTFVEYYRGCSNYLGNVSRTLWPRRTRHITLYSMRHQFSANAKASGRSLEAIAAMMGHGSIKTAITHYARKSSGRGDLQVSPLEADVETVTLMNQGVTGLQKSDKQASVPMQSQAD